MELEEKQSKLRVWIFVILFIALCGAVYWYFFSPSPQKTAVSDVTIFSPKAEEIIKSPLKISGEARGTWFFEGSFPVVLKDENGNTVKEGFVTAQKDWMTQDFVPFIGELEFDTPEVGKGELILKKDNPSDLREYDKSTSIPVGFSLDKTTIQLFFSDINKDPQVLECGKTYPVSRVVPKVSGIAKKAIEELLKGTTTDESLAGIKTNIPKETVLQSISIEGGVARVDFNLAIQTGGSCRVAAIRSQIANTLRQFPSVSEVVISVNGNSAEALQP
ncbi:MAG: GerMN domain-containing protein [Patescibacteria group bacterium]